MTRKTTKNDGFSTVFGKFWVLVPILAHHSNSVDNFASLDTPGDPRGVKVVELSGMKPKSADSVTVNRGSL